MTFSVKITRFVTYATAQLGLDTKLACLGLEKDWVFG